jgi:hypothetical protein
VKEKKEKKKVFYSQKKNKAQVYSTACVMCYDDHDDDATSHITTHDTTLIVQTPLSHGTPTSHSHSRLSLYILFPLYVSLLLQEKISGGREERRRRRRSSARGPMRPHLGLNFLFRFFFLQFIGLVLSFVKIVAKDLFNSFLGLIYYYFFFL